MTRGVRTFKVRKDIPNPHQKYLDEKKCNRCGTQLIVPDTWGAGNKKVNNYLCNSCESMISKVNRLKRLARVVSRSVIKQYDTAKDGYVYIISNPIWCGWYKIGMAIDAEDRLNSYQTSSPFRDYVLDYSKYFSNRRNAEAIAHRNIEKVADKRQGEWFNVSKATAINIIEEIIDETNT